MSPVNLTVLGATGSVGTSTLDVVARHPERYRLFALTANTGAAALLELCRRHAPRYAVLAGASPHDSLQRQFAQVGTELLSAALSGGGDLGRQMAGTWEVLLPAIATPDSLNYYREFLARQSMRGSTPRR